VSTHAATHEQDRARWEPPQAFEEYRVVQRLGRGTMGKVYLAHDRLLDRLVAIKFVDGLEVGAGARERFYAEARAVARLSHPNIVAVHRIGEVQRRPYLVSEYVCGPSLDRVPRPIRWERVLKIGLGLARGLASAHQGGVLHCDIKPANAVLAIGDEAKLIDFGLAMLLDSAARPDAGDARPPPAALEQVQLSETATLPGRAAGVDYAAVSPSQARSPGRSSGAIAGTPLYLAPELWRGEPPSCPSDVYALGVLLYELACGRAPHAGLPILDIACRAMQEDVESLASRAASVPGALASVIDACLGRDPSRRPPRGDALCAMLEAVAGDLSRPS
jgi:serine/threonine protein kinase